VIKQLKLGAFTYKVVLDPKLKEIASNLGMCLTDSLTLVLDANMPDALEAEVLLHECLHALWAQTGLTKEYDNDQEEKAVFQLSPLIFGFLRDNPKVVAWITQAGR
jgi:hypothetical protein